MKREMKECKSPGRLLYMTKDGVKELREMTSEELGDEAQKIQGFTPSKLMAGTPENVDAWLRKLQGIHYDPNTIEMEWDEESQSFKNKK